MADINKAIRWINEGKKVRRPTWHSNNCWFKDDDGSISLELVDRVRKPIFIVEDFEATDWEILNNKKKEIKYFGSTLKEGTKEYDMFMNGNL